MNDPVRVDKASLDALTETMRGMSVQLATKDAELAAKDAAIAERDLIIAQLRALLAQHGLVTADEATEPEDCNDERL